MNKFDPDQALAILLQARYNEEAKKQNNKENRPVPQAPLGFKKPLEKASLIDPDWETTDPCPDIYGLFVAFNERFFWGRLLGVEVKWSPQMTSCAGICVYEGRNGLCSVRLSAPLLKLRPRSDLVETLLHEMIHAYLFVTNNNRDRDGHGPEFHKHMYRINKEAGTNITVYHSFHAEVKVYQQHWWRCNGPCQSRAPFFGMVKRAKNRAPGPYDLWWADHQAACGGQFIKVREPENYKNKKKSKINNVSTEKNAKDIRNFFKKPAAVNGAASATATDNKSGSNIFGFSNIGGNVSQANNQSSVAGSSAVNRVVGFGDLSSSGPLSTAKVKPPSSLGRGYTLGGGTSGGSNRKDKSPGQSPRSGRGRGGMLANRGGGTLVVTGSQGRTKPVENPESPNTKLRIDNFKAFSGSGYTLGGPSSSADRSKSRLLSIGQEPERKKQKISYETEKEQNKRENSDFGQSEDISEMCKCSVCNKSMPREEVDVHLETCAGLQNVFNNSSAEDISDEQEVNDINKKYKVSSCPVCSLHIEGDMNTHLDECLNMSGILNMVDVSSFSSSVEISDNSTPENACGRDIREVTLEDSDVEIIEPEDRVACPICGMRFGESRINSHVNQCLDSEDQL